MITRRVNNNYGTWTLEFHLIEEPSEARVTAIRGDTANVTALKAIGRDIAAEFKVARVTFPPCPAIEAPGLGTVPA